MRTKKKAKKPFYAKMPGGVFIEHLGTNPQRWAEAYIELNGDKPLDHGLLLSWFANAIMAGYDVGRKVRGR